MLFIPFCLIRRIVTQGKDIPVLRHACIQGDFTDPGIHGKVRAHLLDQPPHSRVLAIADGLYGANKELWDKPEKKWGESEYRDLLGFMTNHFGADLSNVVIAVFVTDDQYAGAEAVFKEAGLTCRSLVWYKGSNVKYGERLVQDHETIIVAFKGNESKLVVNIDFSGDKRRYSTVLHCGRVCNPYMFPLGVRLNAYQKPINVIDNLILKFTVPGDVVIDLTFGSNTTGVGQQPCGTLVSTPACSFSYISTNYSFCECSPPQGGCRSHRRRKSMGTPN
jgi:hypothetical protein